MNKPNIILEYQGKKEPFDSYEKALRRQEELKESDPAVRSTVQVNGKIASEYIPIIIDGVYILEGFKHP